LFANVNLDTAPKLHQAALLLAHLRAAKNNEEINSAANN